MINIQVIYEANDHTNVVIMDADAMNCPILCLHYYHYHESVHTTNYHLIICYILL